MIISHAVTFLNRLRIEAAQHDACGDGKQEGLRLIINDVYRLVEAANNDSEFGDEMYLTSYGNIMYAFNGAFWGNSGSDRKVITVLYLEKFGGKINEDRYPRSRNAYPPIACTLDRKGIEEFMDCFVC